MHKTPEKQGVLHYVELTMSSSSCRCRLLFDDVDGAHARMMRALHDDSDEYSMNVISCLFQVENDL